MSEPIQAPTPPAANSTSPRSLGEIAQAKTSFYDLCKQLNLVDPEPPNCERLRRVLEWYLPRRVRRLRRALGTEAQDWLERVLQIECLLLLGGVRIGVHLITPARFADEGLLRVCTEPFGRARQALGIAAHWYILLPNFPIAPAQLLSKLEAQLRSGREVDVLDLSPAESQETPPATNRATEVRRGAGRYIRDLTNF
jgi:hypothetical protein